MRRVSYDKNIKDVSMNRLDDEESSRKFKNLERELAKSRRTIKQMYKEIQNLKDVNDMLRQPRAAYTDEDVAVAEGAMLLDLRSQLTLVQGKLDSTTEELEYQLQLNLELSDKVDSIGRQGKHLN